MFGHVKANREDLTDAAYLRYRAVYCGLCHTLANRFGAGSRMLLTFDLTYLALLLSALYEPDEQKHAARCCVHPIKQQDYVQSAAIDYAADMTVALTYHKCRDDRMDDASPVGWCGEHLLKKQYARVKAAWPKQCAHIEKELSALAALEQEQSRDADAAAKCFGRLMAGVFLWKEDRWSEELSVLGYGLGRFIYLADAAIDRDKDEKHGSYNPLTGLDPDPELLRPILMTVLGTASIAFERLPIVEDTDILKNILYSGIWMKFNRAVQKRQEKLEKKQKQPTAEQHMTASGTTPQDNIEEATVEGGESL